MKNALKTYVATLLMAGVVDNAIAGSGELGNEFLSHSEMVRTVVSFSSSRFVARNDQDEQHEVEDWQEGRHRELDEDYLSLISERLEQDADHQEALRKLEQERAGGADVAEDYRELLEDRREQDAEHRNALRELNRQRDEYNQEFAPATAENDVESDRAETLR